MIVSMHSLLLPGLIAVLGLLLLWGYISVKRKYRKAIKFWAAQEGVNARWYNSTKTIEARIYSQIEYDELTDAP